VSLLARLRGGLIVSVQAWKGSALNDPPIIAAMARAAQENGAAAVRVEGVEDLRAVRSRVELPIIGLIKRVYADFEPYITPTLPDVRDVIETEAEIVAFDGTLRLHPNGATVEGLVEAVHGAGRLAMADCGTFEDAVAAAAAGADILATTLCGYTGQTLGEPLPALSLVRQMRTLGAFVVCEGGIRNPSQVREAIDVGADAVVVGTAITNVDWLVREFAGAADRMP
jgi:N-acylglucosamine-6-phosphate 2-epimerase